MGHGCELRSGNGRGKFTNIPFHSAGDLQAPTLAMPASLLEIDGETVKDTYIVIP
jgi:hypothetical protein